MQEQLDIGICIWIIKGFEADLFLVFGNKIGFRLIKTSALFFNFKSEEWETGCSANLGRLWLKWLIWLKKLMEKENQMCL